MPRRLARVDRAATTPDGAVWVGRGSVWPCPFHPGARYVLGLPGKEHVPTPTTRSAIYPDVLTVKTWDEVPELYRVWVTHHYGIPNIQRLLGGKDLACYCHGDMICHGDTLLELAN